MCAVDFSFLVHSLLRWPTYHRTKSNLSYEDRLEMGEPVVDFGKLSMRQKRAVPVEPGEIFLRLPKSPGFDDLWSSQADALKQWFKRRDESDIVIKLNTGGGKTLVGLLIAQSTINEQNGPVLYLCPTVQLRDQILEQAKRYGIKAVPYVSGKDIPEEFFAGEAVLVATYQALFNGLSKFGTSGTTMDPIRLQGIILDDAHTAFSSMRDIFSLSIGRAELGDLYEELTTLFRADFAGQARQGTYDDILSQRDDAILEVPYASWSNRADGVRQRIAPFAKSKFRFVWPLLRDAFEQCHALVSKDQFVITPLQPMVDLFPSFTSCNRRIYMSATVADDSSIIRTFDANETSVSNPISPTSLAGVGERMILIPELTRLQSSQITNVAKALAKGVAATYGTVILIPSNASARKWRDIATIAQGDEVATAVNQLVSRSHNGPYALPNRYDGIDLHGDSCRLLIISGLPQGSNIYDLFRATVLEGSGTINATLAQRIEQGMGRGTRGGGDHCVVLLLENDLVGWISRGANLQLLTNTTQEQVRIGLEVSREIISVQELEDTMNKCIDRSSDWTQFHADAIADASTVAPVNADTLSVAAAERKYFGHVRNGYYLRATASIEKFVEGNVNLHSKVKGWLLELGARASHYGKNIAVSEQLQRAAYSYNKNLCRPASAIHYTPLGVPTKQAENIADYVEQFALLGGALADFDRIVAHLVETATSNQFEEALKNLGSVLGFSSERPEKEQQQGPDVLWILNGSEAWVMEAKSRKQADKKLNKEEHGQLLQSCLWFDEHYQNLHQIGVVVHPNASATMSVTVGPTMALTLPKLREIVGSVRILMQELTSERISHSDIVARCDSRLRDLSLDPGQITQTYLSPFVVE